MKHTKRHKLWIPLLMLTSASLLIVFLISWLLAQYDTAEKQLQKDVRADLRKTSEQLMDSLMLEFLDTSHILPFQPTVILSDSNKLFSNNQLQEGATQIKIVVKADDENPMIDLRNLKELLPKAKAGIVHVSTETKNGVVISQTSEKIVEDSLLNELFRKSAGAVAKKLANYQRSGNILSVTKQEFDTALCRKLMRQNWQNSALDYQLVFKDDKAEKATVYSENLLFQKQFGVTLTNKSNVLYATILPEFFFALFLLISTLVAFIVAYRSYLRQVRINLLRTDFVNNISHELKTPVSTVRVALDALLHYRKDDSAVRDEYLQLMAKEVDRLDQLIHQVLQHGRLETMENQLQFTTVNLNSLIDELLLRYRLKVEEKGATIHYHQPDFIPELQADAEHLSGVIGNLIENALQYAGKHPEITITLHRTAKQLVLEIQDNGPGIASEYHSQLFKPFFRVPSGNTHNVKGYGLGLSYCKQIVEQHNGTLSVRNLTSGGCAFLITLNR